MDDIIKKILAFVVVVIGIASTFVIGPLNDFRNLVISHIIAGLFHLVGIDIDPNSFFNLLSSIENFAIAAIPLIIVGSFASFILWVIAKLKK